MGRVRGMEIGSPESLRLSRVLTMAEGSFGWKRAFAPELALVEMARGMDRWFVQESCGEENGEGKALVASESSEEWRRQKLPEMKENASSGCLAFLGRLGGLLESGRRQCSGLRGFL